MVVNTHLDGGIDQVKQMLVNGYILNIPTYIDSWQYKTIGDDPSTSEDDAFTGKNCVSWVNGTSGYHAMTVVGYNDNIWVDINGNNAVDSGEKGAFRIANSWGTGWGEAGYAWMAYDALKNPSAVSDGPSTGRIYGWYPSRAHWVTARTGYEPKVIGKFTLNHAKRDHLRMTLGVSDINTSVPSVTWIPEMIYNQGGAYAFNGTTTAVEATFVFDFTDLLPYADGLSTWYLGVQDDTEGSEATLSTFTLIDVANGNQAVQSLDVPETADGTQVYAGVDYDTTGNNMSPTAVADASIYSGYAPLVVTFYGTSSYDSDGDIFSYDWDFGDGASQSDPQVTHTYDQPGMYTATLTVTDDLGAIDTDSVSIEVVADPTKQVYVSDIQATPLVDETGTTVRVSVEILDSYQNPVGGANVTGHWSELVSGNVSGTTSASGMVEWVSPATTQSGTITFTVDSVTASGYEYDDSLNTRASVNITVEESGNQNPLAVIEADSLSGTAPWTITFDGRSSYDPDGSLISYEWRVDGSVATSGTSADTFIYDFSTAGTYEVSLIVEDNNGAVSAADEVIVTIQSASETLLMHVDYITVTVQQRGVNSQGLAEVKIIDNDGNPVANAEVVGAWSGIVEDNQTGTADSDGIASFKSPKTKTSGSFEFTVENVTAAGYIYSPNNNVMSWDFTDTP